MENKETFGQRFAKLRKQFNYTQEDVASKINVSAQAVSKWENDVSMPDIELLVPISNLFCTTVDQLLGKEPKTVVLSPENRKNINKMLLKIVVNSEQNGDVTVNLPIAILKVLIQAGIDMPTINDSDVLKSIDFNKIFELIEQGVVGELVRVDSKNGEHVVITVE